MNLITIDKAGEHEGREVTLRGWLYNLRESGKLLFPIFRDGTALMQGVVSQKEQPEAFAALRGLTQESSVEVTGKIRREPRAPGGYEIGVSGVQDADLKKLQDTYKLTTPLTVAEDKDGPSAYKLNKEAAVTVLVYKKGGEITKKFAFKDTKEAAAKAKAVASAAKTVVE